MVYTRWDETVSTAGSGMTGVMVLDGKSAARGKDLFDVKFDVFLYVVTARILKAYLTAPAVSAILLPL